MAFGRSKYFSYKIENINELLQYADETKEKNSQEYLDKVNNNRVDINFNNQKVFIRNLNTGKMDPPYIGPFRVIEDVPAYNCLTVDQNGIPTRLSYRDVKLFKEEESVMTHN